MTPVVIGAALCALAVVLGAFGAHAVADMLTLSEKAWWDTATDYLWYHGLACLALGARRAGTPIVNVIRRLLLPGTIIFSGSLYLYAFTGFRPLGMITPIGGSLLILGWLRLLWLFSQTHPQDKDKDLSD